MKKIITFEVALAAVISMAVPAFAVTPALEVLDMPKISNIKIDITIGSNKEDDVVGTKSFWDRWFAEHPIVFPSGWLRLR